MIACDEAVMAQEAAFLTSLGAARTFALAADRLTLSDEAGKALVAFSAQSQELAGTWQVLGYHDGASAVVSPVEGTTPTFEFTDDSVSGTAGCNRLNSGYTLDGTAIKLGPFMSTRMACAEPAERRGARRPPWSPPWSRRPPSSVEGTTSSCGARTGRRPPASSAAEVALLSGVNRRAGRQAPDEVQHERPAGDRPEHDEVVGRRVRREVDPVLAAGKRHRGHQRAHQRRVAASTVARQSRAGAAPTRTGRRSRGGWTSTDNASPA